jgi:hypothetical protein
MKTTKKSLKLKFNEENVFVELSGYDCAEIEAGLKRYLGEGDEAKVEATSMERIIIRPNTGRPHYATVTRVLGRVAYYFTRYAGIVKSVNVSYG